MLVHHFTAKIFCVFVDAWVKMKVFLFCSLHSVFFAEIFSSMQDHWFKPRNARAERWPTFVSRVVRQTRASDTRVRSDKTSRAYLHVISAPWVTSSMWESQTFELCSVKKHESARSNNIMLLGGNFILFVDSRHISSRAKQNPIVVR